MELDKLTYLVDKTGRVDDQSLLSHRKREYPEPRDSQP